MAAKTASKASLGLSFGSRGQAFYEAAVAGFELTGSELELLAEVCRLLDEIDLLQSAVGRDGVTAVGSTGQPRVHPGLGEVRQHRLALGRLLSQLALPDVEGEVLPSQVSARARKAAQQRWVTARG